MPQLEGEMCSDMTRWALKLQGSWAKCEIDRKLIGAAVGADNGRTEKQ